MSGASLAKQHGALWERHVRKECRALLHGGQAAVDKNWEAPTVPGEKHIKREKSKPDFSGFDAYGRHIVFEAKASLVETRFDFSLISDGQAKQLARACRWGAISFVYVLDGLRRRWVIPWSIIGRVGIKSLSYQENEIYQKRPGETWLDTWRRLTAAGLTQDRGIM